MLRRLSRGLLREAVRLFRRGLRQRARERKLERGIERATGEAEWEGVTTPRVVDGDTLHLESLGLKVRLARIDAPETGEPGGAEATRSLYRRLYRADTLNVRIVEEGKYGRAVAELEADGENVSDWMLREGYAERY